MAPVPPQLQDAGLLLAARQTSASNLSFGQQNSFFYLFVPEKYHHGERLATNSEKKWLDNQGTGQKSSRVPAHFGARDACGIACPG